MAYRHSCRCWESSPAACIYNKEGFEHSLAQGLRFAAMTGLGLLVAWTTAPRKLLLGLIRLKMPYGLAFILTTSVRFLPLLMAEIGTVVAVQRLRGVNPVKVGAKRQNLMSGIGRWALDTLEADEMQTLYFKSQQGAKQYAAGHQNGFAVRRVNLEDAFLDLQVAV